MPILIGMPELFLHSKLFSKARLCDTFYKRFIGLMFGKKLKKDESLLFILPRESRLGSSIHMFFVFFPIDVLWLDKNLKVVDIRRSLKPFSFNAMPKNPAKYIIEAAAGKCKNARLGDKFSISL